MHTMPSEVGIVEPIEAVAVNHFFANRFPTEAAAVAPYVVRLFQAWRSGHSYLPLADEEVAHLIDAAPTLVGKQHSPLIIDDNSLFIGSAWQLEADIAREIIRLNSALLDLPDAATVRCYIQQEFPDEMSRSQRNAVALALLNRFMMITGGPGTGKTSTVAKLLVLLQILSPKPLQIAMAAPTGKAAARLTESLRKADKTFIDKTLIEKLNGIEGQTVHRLLGLYSPDTKPLYHAGKRLALDVLIVDEASMLDLSLMLKLLEALPDHCRLILLGDEHQLPSVEAGAILATLAGPTVISPEMATALESWLGEQPFEVSTTAPILAANTAKLTYSRRFGSDSGIGCLAAAVRDGQAEAAWAAFSQFDDVLSFYEGRPSEQVAAFCQKQAAYWQAVEQGDVAQAFLRQADIMALAATKHDVAAWNAACRQYLSRLGIAPVGDDWFAGQPVLITQNDYSLGVFNGDIGIVMPSSQAPEMLLAYFPSVSSGFKTIALNRLPACETAFALTVHKSQGSEYRCVWLIASDEAAAESLDRALLYTAITRAQEQFAFLGSRHTFEQACMRKELRRSGLRKQIALANQSI